MFRPKKKTTRTFLLTNAPSEEPRVCQPRVPHENSFNPRPAIERPVMGILHAAVAANPPMPRRHFRAHCQFAAPKTTLPGLTTTYTVSFRPKGPHLNDFTVPGNWRRVRVSYDSRRYASSCPGHGTSMYFYRTLGVPRPPTSVVFRRTLNPFRHNQRFEGRACVPTPSQPKRWSTKWAAVFEKLIEQPARFPQPKRIPETVFRRAQRRNWPHLDAKKKKNSARAVMSPESSLRPPKSLFQERLLEQVALHAVLGHPHKIYRAGFPANRATGKTVDCGPSSLTAASRNQLPFEPPALLFVAASGRDLYGRPLCHVFSVPRACAN